MMMKNPAVLHALLSHLTSNIADYVCYQIESGAQVVQLFDSWAHHLNPSQFATFSLPYAEEVIKRVRTRHPDTPIIFHANGGKLIYLECAANYVLCWKPHLLHATVCQRCLINTCADEYCEVGPSTPDPNPQTPHHSKPDESPESLEIILWV